MRRRKTIVKLEKFILWFVQCWLMVAIKVNEGATDTLPLENAVVFPVKKIEDRQTANELMLERVCAGIDLGHHILLYQYPLFFPEAAQRYGPYFCSKGKIGREFLD
nr:hypothetical protein [Candidatus Woesearchaeota archaeon]